MDKLTKLYRLFLGLFPRRLPIGAQELKDFSTDIFSLYGIPDLPSYRLCIATLIMHLNPQEAFKTPFWFFRSIRAAQSKEVAYQVIAEDRELRNREEREAKQKAFDLKQAEVIAQQAVTNANQEIQA